MLANIDLRTTIVLSSLSAVLMAVVLYGAHRNFPRSIRGLGHWAAGSALLPPAALLFALRGSAPDWLSMIVANGLMYWSIALWAIGSDRFLQRNPPTRLLWIGFVLMLCGTAWFTLVSPDYRSRLSIFSFFCGLLFLYQTLQIARHSRRNWASRLFAVAMAAQASVVGARFLTSLRSDLVTPNLFATDHINAIYLITYNLMTLCLPVTFLMVAIQRLHEELERLASLDPLTHLLNRRAFLVACAGEQQRIKRHGKTLSLLAIDIDHFKTINDQYGHAKGDRVLVNFARLMANVLRKMDVVGRFGGEEFLVLLPETSRDQGIAAANRIRAALVNDRREDLPPVTVSIGLATLDDPSESLDSLLLRADQALYRAKALGRDRLELAEMSGTPLAG